MPRLSFCVRALVACTKACGTLASLYDVDAERVMRGITVNSYHITR